MYCLELIKFDVSNTSCYAEAENGALLHVVARSWKMILGNSWEIFRGKVWKPPDNHTLPPSKLISITFDSTALEIIYVFSLIL